MSDFDFSDSSVFLDLGVADLADLSGPVAIPDVFAPPPQLDLAGLGFAPYELELVEPLAPDVAGQQLLDQQLASDRLALDLWERALADDQLLAEADAPDALELWTPDAETLNRPLGSSGVATTAKRRLKAAVKESRQRSRAAAGAAAEKGRALDPERHERAAELAKDAAAKLKKLGSRGEIAIEPARLALADASDPGRGAFLFTLGRAFLAAGRLSSARRVAELAIEAGMSLGHELLAELLFREDGASTTKQRQQAYVGLLEQVDERDRIAYYGTSRSGSDVVRAALGSQRVKLTETLEHGRSGWRAARAEVGERGKKLVESSRAWGSRPSRES